MPRPVKIILDGKWQEVSGYTSREFSELKNIPESTLKKHQIIGIECVVRDLKGPLWIPNLYDRMVNNSIGRPTKIRRPKKQQTPNQKRGRKQNTKVINLMKEMERKEA